MATKPTSPSNHHSNNTAYPMPSYELFKPHIRAGHNFIVLKRHHKEPLNKNWPNLCYSGTPKSYMQHGFNLGIRLSVLDLVVDVDPRNFPIINGKRYNSFKALAGYIGYDFALAPRVRTRSNGLHYYFHKPPTPKISGTHRLFPGIEFKSKGQQVVAAGSVHPDTRKHYRIDPDPFIDELWMAPDAPQALLDLIAKPSAKPTTTPCGTHTPEQLAHMLNGLDPRDYRDQARWLEMMMASHDATAGEGGEEFIEWSINDPDYRDHAATIRRRWESLDPEKMQKVSYKTLYKELHKKKKDHLIPPPTSAEDDFEAINPDELQPYLKD